MTPNSDHRSLRNCWRNSLVNLKILSGSVAKQVYGLLFRSWINALLLCVPAGIALGFVPGPVVAVLVVNFLAAVGLLGLGDAILRSITARIGTRYGMLLYISTSNLMQAISSIILLLRGEIVMMQMSLIGNLQANLLLLPALSVFYATLRQKSMVHDIRVTKKYTLLLFLATSGFVAPTVFDKETDLPVISTAGVSRGVSVLLMLTYGAYLFFQLSTHKELFGCDQPVKQYPTGEMDAHVLRAKAHNGSCAPQRQRSEAVELSIWTASVMFVITTALVYFCVDFVVNSILELRKRHNSPSFGFSGYILIPVLNCDVAAVEQAERSMNAVLTFTFDKSLQMALFFSPFLVLVAWGAGFDEASLSFDILAVTTLFTSVFLVNAISASGNFNLLHGIMMMALYAVLSLAVWFYPVQPYN